MADTAALLRYRDEAHAKYHEAIRCSRLGGSQGANGEELDRLASQEERFRRRYEEAQTAVDQALGRRG